MEVLRIFFVLGISYLISQLFAVLLIDFKLIQSKEKNINRKAKYLALALAFVLIIGLMYFPKKDVILALTIGLFIAALFGLFYAFLKFIIYLSEQFSVNKQRVDSVDHTGFKIVKGNKIKQFYWRDILWLKFDRQLFRLTIRTKSRIILDKKTKNIYLLLRIIPIGFKDFDHVFIESFFSELETCIVCGTKAFQDTNCLSCGCTSWNIEIEKNYQNYDEYIIANQLEIFATSEKNEKFNDFRIVDKNFEHDSKWSPKVSKAEVLEFSKREYWEKE